MSGIDLRSVACALGGEVSGAQVLAPGPGHSARDRSMSIRLDPHAPGGLLVHSFCGDNPLRLKDYVRQRLRLLHWAEVNSSPANRATSADAARTVVALANWQEACDPRATPVEVYFHRRGLELPGVAVSEAIRFHPACPFAGARTPAMVCLVRDIVTNVPKAIHRTALTLDGEQVRVGGHVRLSLGPIGDGAIKLNPDADVTTCLGIGEGLESTLSLHFAGEFGPSPVWCLLSAGGMASFPVLPGIECLWVAVDHDVAGLRAAKTCSERWRAAGRDVFLVKPRVEGCDLNDIVKEEQRDARS